jgi:hypothetical protein
LFSSIFSDNTVYSAKLLIPQNSSSLTFRRISPANGNLSCSAETELNFNFRIVSAAFGGDKIIIFGDFQNQSFFQLFDQDFSELTDRLDLQVKML